MTEIGPHKNLGAPIRRDGEIVARRGEVFIPTEDELVRKAYKLRPVPPESRPKLVKDQPKASKAAEAETKSDADDGPDAVDEVDQFYTGGAMYTLPGGERVRGKDAAAARLKELRGGTNE